MLRSLGTQELRLKNNISCRRGDGSGDVDAIVGIFRRGGRMRERRWVTCSHSPRALQFVQDNPDEVCPAGWKPGEKSMKPDPKLSKEYFSAI
ncbi:hypothetical protein GIB67_042083 [Kingdonia uniflora]|uniref:thioredoxin-dependent peroxiredoxin n=1 Tax=Kingdonia uniflora TaxID=39325 RepID=A0A7J7MW34_9MAGN|nr:hypothetical protein GIB67_042083 [Kingdonia uniflora]